MHLVLSTYKAPPDIVAQHLDDHRAWVEVHYRSGIFVLSGRRDPFVGGFMLVQGVERDALGALLATDPFRVADILDHEIIGLSPTRSSDALSGLMDTRP